MSRAFENLPTPSGSFLARCCLAIASLSVVDLAWCSWRRGVCPCFVARFAAVLASDPSAKSLTAGAHWRWTEFPLWVSREVSSYICRMIAWPDCCRGCLIAANAEWFLVMTVTSLWQTLGGRFFRAVAMLVNSAVYGFCSSLVPMVTAYFSTASPVLSERVSCALPPMPTLSFFTDELVAIAMPVA